MTHQQGQETKDATEPDRLIGAKTLFSLVLYMAT